MGLGLGLGFVLGFGSGGGGFWPSGFEGQLPIDIPNILMHGAFGALISKCGSVGNSPPGGGPGSKFHSTIGTFRSGGMMTGTTVALDEPGGVVVIH